MVDRLRTSEAVIAEALKDWRATFTEPVWGVGMRSGNRRRYELAFANWQSAVRGLEALWWGSEGIKHPSLLAPMPTGRGLKRAEGEDMMLDVAGTAKDRARVMEHRARLEQVRRTMKAIEQGKAIAESLFAGKPKTTRGRKAA